MEPHGGILAPHARAAPDRAGPHHAGRPAQGEAAPAGAGRAVGASPPRPGFHLRGGPASAPLHLPGRRDHPPARFPERAPAARQREPQVPEARQSAAARADERRASDIHIEPFENELKVRYRIDGVLHDVEAPARRLQAAIVSRVKIMSKLNIAERRLPQDGRIKLRLMGREIDLRVSTLPTLYGESVVIRIIDRSSIVVTLGSLGFPEDTLAQFDRLVT